MGSRRVLLEAAEFMDSAQAVQIEGATTAEVRKVVQRFLTACYEDLGKAPRLLDGEDLSLLLGELLPRRFAARDPLATATPEVLAGFLAFLGESQIVGHAFELGMALDDRMPEFLAKVESGEALRGGLPAGASSDPFVHRAGRTGRNDPCPCGSGKKFKKCCMDLGGPGQT